MRIPPESGTEKGQGEGRSEGGNLSVALQDQTPGEPTDGGVPRAMEKRSR